MEYTHKDYKVDEALQSKLKDKLKQTVFLQLNKDMLLKDTVYIASNIPVPMRSEELVNGIKSGDLNEEINFKSIIDAMVYVIGSDSEFKYNDEYISILKNIDKSIDSFILTKAFELLENKNYFDALIHFIALDKISDNHKAAQYNIANTLRYMAIDAKNKESDDYTIYYELSFYEFQRLTSQYPDFPLPYYYLGYYYSNDDKYEQAFDMWQKSYDLMEDEDKKRELSGLMDGVTAKMIFEDAREEVLNGDVMEGIKKLIPILDKHNDWSEAKYYAALGYRKLDNYKKAEVFLNELIEDGESFPEIYNELGLCYFNNGDIEKAIHNFKTAVSLKDEPGYLCNLGIACFNAGKKDEAKKYIEKAYELNPQDELTKKCKNWAGGI